MTPPFISFNITAKKCNSLYIFSTYTLGIDANSFYNEFLCDELDCKNGWVFVDSFKGGFGWFSLSESKLISKASALLLLFCKYLLYLSFPPLCLNYSTAKFSTSNKLQRFLYRLSIVKVSSLIYLDANNCDVLATPALRAQN